MRRPLLCVLALLLSAIPLQAQGLRGKMYDLFQFGACGEPLCLNVDNAHGSHYITASTHQSGQILAFVANAIGTSIANVPIGGASGGATFTFEGGLPVRSSVSSGPIFAERAETIGRGRIVAGTNATAYRFTTVRGTPLDAMSFTFVHQNVGNPALGNPAFENDVIEVRTDLEVSLAVASLFATYGLTDRIDVGVAVPLVYTSLSGASRAHIVPFGDTPHSFEPDRTQLQTDAYMTGSAIGVGDVLLRTKLNVGGFSSGSIAVLGDVRLPTGDQDDMLGSGSASARALGVASARYGDFSPHLNAGFAFRGGEFERSAILATAGFDQLLAPWATLAVDVISSWEVGDEKLTLPPPASFDVPFPRSVPLTNIRSGSDDVVYMSLGAKLLRGESLTFVTNALVPVVRGGFQPTMAVTLGIEYNR
jgi:hypothetical protein